MLLKLQKKALVAFWQEFHFKTLALDNLGMQRKNQPSKQQEL